MKKIKIICGKGGSGKDHIMKYIMDNNLLEDPYIKYITDIPQYTTRPVRSKLEENGRNIFLTDEEFDLREKRGEFFAIENYDFIMCNRSCKVKYGFSKNDFQDTYGYIVIIYGVSLKVAKDFLSLFGKDNVEIIYIYAIAENCLNSMIKREKKNNCDIENDKIYEICKRVLLDRENTDETDFVNLVDHVIVNKFDNDIHLYNTIANILKN